MCDMCVCLDYTSVGLGAMVDKGVCVHVCVCVRCWLRQTLLCRRCDGQTKVCWSRAGFCFLAQCTCMCIRRCVWHMSKCVCATWHVVPRLTTVAG